MSPDMIDGAGNNEEQEDEEEVETSYCVISVEFKYSLFTKHC